MKGSFHSCLLVAILALQPLVPALADDPAPARIFRIEREGLPPSWLFGTYHSSDPEVLSLPPEVRDALVQSRSVAVELLPEEMGDLSALQALLLPTGVRMAALVPDDLHERVIAAFAEVGIPASLADQFWPWAAALTLDYGKENLLEAVEGAQILDDSVIEMSRKGGKTVVGLETADEQVELLREMSLECQIAYLETSVEAWEVGPGEERDLLLSLYLRGDHAGMFALFESYRPLLGNECFAALEHALLTGRNRRMAARLAPMLEVGEVLVAVGALHLPGPEGLFALLRDEGWEIVPLR